MIIDALSIPENTIIEKDICIVGGGAAGITIARELRNQPYEVCILESGGFDFEQATQSLYDGANAGISYFPLGEARARYLGGSTNLWGGWSRPFDEVDFEKRSWVPYSGWPVTRSELLPYYHRAQQACHLGPYAYDVSSWEETLKQLQCDRLPLNEAQVETCIWQVIPPTHLRFGEAYRTELEQAKNVSTYLHANVLEIETNDTAQAVTRLQVASLDGKKFWVKAKVFILAVGGIENPRLLLLANKVQRCGLGNQHDLVGRFFMEHPLLKSGKVQFSQPAGLYTQKVIQAGELYMGAGFNLPQAVQEREQLLNFSTRLLPVRDEGLEAFQRLRHRIPQTKTPEAFPKIVQGHRYRNNTSIVNDLGKVVTHLDSVVAKIYTKLLKSNAVQQPQGYNTLMIGEQAPNPDSRVTLSPERDKLGLNRVKLDWRLNSLDKYTMLRSQQLVAQELERSGVGQLQIELTNDDASWQSLTSSYHHMGTTRMSSSPKQGVVDENCRIHGMGNLYVAGSSVFPTGGHSNPTLTIVALSIRLADRVKAQMSSANAIGAMVGSGL
ncbi:FAD-dependent oxidoreductase [Gloeocapsopsis dulcis]|uniref:GMC oxidoreductase n=1 Tax=Gloeocapsopsis dulcis AAB1 = 1H9 TaxID=1433147 RepID=A0A6N8FY93_9CHRO|nr:GMC family oxidoreductase [Gloeocapsopsis dulcis]MUL38110.1 GMC oxidoreductase [Gloeocapsopsis dulcis AAB1 = 1H9]WNN89373.1 GMC family oxidoreductase [Gloeocapsopsis dulcis]